MKVLDFGKNKGKTLAACEESYLEWLAIHEKVLAVRNRWASRDAKFILKRKNQMIIERTLRPYGCRDHEMQVGRMVDGKFQVERGIWNVTKDSRLKVSRKFEGRGTQTDVHYKVEVSGDYPLVIALKEKYNHEFTRPDYRYEVLYSPSK